MKQVVTNLRRCPNGYYIFYSNIKNAKWMYFLEATTEFIYILKAYVSDYDYTHKKRMMETVFKHETRSRMTLTTGAMDGILFQIDEGDYMLELAEEI